MEETSLAIVNARVITLDPKKPAAEAIYIENDRIISVGTNQTIRRYATERTRFLDAHGYSVVPGLIDCHVHMTSFGKQLTRLDLTNISSISELQKKLQSYAHKNPSARWIIGRGWDQDKFPDHRMPTREDLDASVSDKPVLITRICGHVAVANTKALEQAGITNRTQTKGGIIELDSTGQPNGILKENAIDLMRDAIPKQNKQELRKSMELACQRAVQNGLTAVHWLVDSSEEIQTLQEMRNSHRLPLRVYLGISNNLLNELVGLGIKTGFGDNWLKIGFLKLFADGSLGARTAALSEPYADDPDNTGMLLYSQEELDNTIQRAHDAGLQIGVHAIGDKAIQSTLVAYENALKKNPRKNHRHRIEHYSVLNHSLIGKSKKLGIVACVQPHFIVSDYWIKDRLGEDRSRMAYPFRTLLRQGIRIVSSSDCPIENISPILGIWAATSQQPHKEENITPLEALKTYTAYAAYASFEEKEKGTIKTGNLADLTMLSDDPTKTSPKDIRKIRVEMTFVGGNIVYSTE